MKYVLSSRLMSCRWVFFVGYLRSNWKSSLCLDVAALSKRQFVLEKFLISLLVSVLIAPVAYSGDLISSLDLASSHDPVLQSAGYAHQISLTRIPQAQAAFRPSVSLSSQNNISRGSYSFSGNEPTNRPVRSNSQTLQLTQALYRPVALHALVQAELQAVQSLALLHQAEQDLMQRLLQAYVEMQVVNNQQEVARAQLSTQVLQLEVARRGLLLGLKTLPEVYEAQSKLASAQSQIVDVTSQLRFRRFELLRVTGESSLEGVSQWNVLSDSFALLVWADQVSQKPIDFWLEQARLDAPAVRAQMASLEIAEREVQKNRASHLPTVDLTVSRVRNSSSGNVTSAQNFDSFSTVNQLGVQITLPLYAGGSVSARVREAVSALEKAQFDLEASQLLAQSNVAQSFETVVSAKFQIETLQVAIDAAQLALTSNVTGVRLGTRTPLDVLTSEQQLALVRRDWRKARYDLAFQVVKLKASAGLLDRADLVSLNQGFKSKLSESGQSLGVVRP